MVEEFEIRFATLEDMKDVFNLSNDELVRANSFNPEKINWENHQIWYKDKINNPDCIFYVVKKSEDLIAQVRFDKINCHEVDISISVSSKFRGKGYGLKILKLVSKKVISEQSVKKINAYVKKENIASKRIFEKAEYILKESLKEKERYEYNAK